MDAAVVREGQVMPRQQEISEEQYAEMERKQSERRFFMTGRKRNDDESALILAMAADVDKMEDIDQSVLRKAHFSKAKVLVTQNSTAEALDIFKTNHIVVLILFVG